MKLSSINLYDKPALSNSLVANIDELAWPSYQRETLAMGGHWGAGFTLGAGNDPVDDHILESWFTNNLGNAIVESYGGIVTFKGIINSMRLAYRGDVLAISLDDMANSIAVQYTKGKGHPQTTSPFYTDAASVATYGAKSLIIRAKTPLSDSAAQQLAQAKLAQLAWPRAYPDDLGSFNGGRGQLDVEVIGIVRTMDWVVNYNTSTTTDTLDDAIAHLVDLAQFVELGELEANATTISRESDNEFLWKRLETIVTLDDNGMDAQWIAGIYADNKLDYKQVDETTITYFRDMKKQQRILTDASGGLVPAPFVQPGVVAFTRDILAGQNISTTLRRDPRAAFIEAVQYSRDGVRLRGSKLRGNAVANQRMAVRAALQRRQLGGLRTTGGDANALNKRKNR